MILRVIELQRKIKRMNKHETGTRARRMIIGQARASPRDWRHPKSQAGFEATTPNGQKRGIF